MMQQDAQPASRFSGLAIASLVVAFLGARIIGLLAFPVAFILAIVALVQIRGSHGRLRGMGFAIAGLCVSVLMPVMLYPVFARAREVARKTNCQSNVESISSALRAFATEKGAYPKAAAWCDDLVPYLESPQVFVCADAPGLDSAYAYNAALSGAPVDSVAPDTVTIVESDAGWNASGAPQQLMPARPRHLGGDIFGYADGSARWERRGSRASPKGEKPWMGDVPSRSGRGPAGRARRGTRSP